MNNQSNSVLMFIAGGCIGILLTALWFLALQNIQVTPSTTATTSASAHNTLPEDESGSVSIQNQKAGEVVFVESVTVPAPGVWVAVREVTGVTLGNILGAARARGPITNLEIPLLRATAPSSLYALQLYRDNGDDLFTTDQDSVYVDFDTGKPVIAPFKTF